MSMYTELKAITGWSDTLKQISLSVGLCTCMMTVGQSAANNQTVDYPIATKHYPVVLSGKSLSVLQGEKVGSLSLYRYTDNTFKPVPFQIDQRDEDERFEIAENPDQKKRLLNSPLDTNDELCFMAADLGIRASDESLRTLTNPVGIQIRDIESRQSGWIYVASDASKTILPDTLGYVRYDNETDTATSDIYQISFSKQRPLFANAIRWNKGDGHHQIGDNIIDSMKIQHTGKLFHAIAFERTHGDYYSELIGVKQGPVRVIRQTRNKIRMFLGIKSPALDVDFLIYRDNFVMDIIVDFPFDVGMVFSDLVATPSIDHNGGLTNSPISIYTESDKQGMPINGQPSEAKQRLNERGDKSVVIEYPNGKMVADISVKQGSPVTSHVVLTDDQKLNDPPEGQPGQFGKVGFKMENWERLKTNIEHILFRAYMLKNNKTVSEAFHVLAGSPRFINTAVKPNIEKLTRMSR